ncbi:MAG: S-layer homology domain-containing protein [Trueperaceae bacterium]|nr:S-layer homology domain-containing protein [Trueperaceae bacterium]
MKQNSERWRTYLGSLWLLVGLGAGIAQPPRDAPFTDVAAGHYAAEAVERVREAGIFIGFPDGTFRGEEPLTWSQAELVLARLLAATGIGSSPRQDIDTLVAELLSGLGDDDQAHPNIDPDRRWYNDQY